MEEGKFVADFIATNIEKIFTLGKKAFGKADAAIQTRLKTAYTEYLNSSRLKHSKSKTFFIRNQPVELYSYYVPTGIACGDKLVQKPEFGNCLEFTKRVVISGTGGSGKSVLMKHLFLDCIRTKAYTPILIELRDLNSYEKSLDEFIAETLQNFGFVISDDYIKNAKIIGHFCYFFDGFDEVSPKLRNKILKQISSLDKKFPKCPIFLSSRPDDILTGLDDFSTFSMMPLELSEALTLVDKLPFDEIIKKKFCDHLSSGLFEKHKSFLSNPLLLSIMLLTYGENAEIPSKLSIFYDQAFDALFRRHDAYKGAYSRDKLTKLDIQDFSRIFSLFCLQTYEKRLFKMSRSQCIEFIGKSVEITGINVSPTDFLNDLLSAVCLMIEDGLEIGFSHRSFQEYFVALYISHAAPETQIKLIDRYWQNMVSDNVMQLLREMNPDLFERSLLIPKLEEFFIELKVKRAVGITHFVRYLKQTYASVESNESYGNDIVFIYRSTDTSKRISQSHLLRIAALDYANYILPKKEMLEEKCKLMREKYFSTQDRYNTNSLSVRSQLIQDLDADESWHSIKYLSAAFSTYKKLKTKHSQSTQSFETLLGLK